MLRKADLILVIDGISSTARAAELRTRATGLQASVLGIGIDPDSQPLEPWCDDVRLVESFDKLDERLADTFAEL